MDPRFAEQFQRARVYSARGVSFARRSRNPIEVLLLGLVGIALVALVIILVLPLIVLAAAFALGAVAYLSLRRWMGGLGTPNSSIGPVRTDGRDNVRVIGGDER